MLKQVLYTAGGVAIIFTAGAVCTISTSNSAIRLENQISTAKANINKEQNRRVTLFTNLVEATKSYNNYEGDTLTKLTEARTQAEKGNVTEAKTTLNAVTEAYPELKSQKNYQQTMTEFSKTENRLADFIEGYNNDIRDYNNYTSTFPHSWLLSMSGHSVQKYQQSEQTVDTTNVNNGNLWK